MKKIYLLILICIPFLFPQKSIGQFTSGNLAVEHLAGASASGTVDSISQYTTATGTNIVGAAAAFPSGNPPPATAPFNLVESAGAASDGFITLATSGSYVCVPGYNGHSGETKIVDSPALATIGTINVARVNSTAGNGGTGLEGNNYRSLASNGTGFWLAGAQGIYYATSATATSGTLISNVNAVAIGIFGGNLYYTNQSGGTVGIFKFTGLPTTAATATKIISNSTSASVAVPNAFSFTPYGDTCYLADGTNGILKFVYNGTAWTYPAAQLAANSTAYEGRGLVVDYSGTYPVVYFTTINSGNRIYTITDGPTANFNVVATPNAGTEFTGLAFTPTSISTQPSNSSACNTSSATFSVTMNACSGSANYSYQWQVYNGTSWSNVPNGSGYTITPSGTNNNISTLTVSSTAAGYVSGYEYQCIITYMGMYTLTTNPAVTLTINQPSTAPTSLNTSIATVCNGGSTILTQTGGTLGTGAYWQWYTNATFTNPVGGQLTTANASLPVNPTTTTTYYLRAEGTTSPCTAIVAAASSVTVTVNTESGNPTSATGSPTTICYGSSTTLTLNGGGGGTGETIHWYTGSCGGTSAGTGNGLLVSPMATTTYYGRYEDGSPCNYSSACQSVTITVDTTSADPISATASSNGL